MGDFLSLELVNGQLLLKYESGGGLTRDKMSRVGTQLNDGYTHHVSISVTPSGASILLDSNNCSSVCYGETRTSIQKPPIFNTQLYVGGIGIRNTASQFHLEDEISLISTISSLRLNHTTIDFNDVMESLNVQLGNIRIGPLCLPDTCSANHQQCRDLWLSYTCDCVSGYSGDTCQLLSTVHLQSMSALQFSLANVSDVIQFGLTFQSDSGFVLSALNKVSL